MDGVVNMLNRLRRYMPDCGDGEEKSGFAPRNFNKETEMSSLGRIPEGDEGTVEQTNFGGEGGDYGSAKYNGMVGVEKDDDGAIGGVSEFDMKTPITEWQAGWNVTNAIQGMFVVSLPYAVKNGGYWGVFAMVFVAYICCHTGKILIQCLYELNERGEKVRVRDSYVAVAQCVLGERYGGKMVNIAQLVELLMTCILYVVLCGDLMFGTFPKGSLDKESWMMVAGMFLLPCAFLKNLRSVSFLSFWCSMVHLVINIIILGYCLTQAGTWAWSKVQMKIDIYYFPISLGIIVFSYTSQIFLPSLEGNLIDRSRFDCMLNWSHIAAAAFKGIFAYLCFLTWANDTEEEITINLPTRGFKGLINFILVIKALLSYPLPFYAAVELLETAFFRGRPTTYFPSCYALDGELKVWGLALRIVVVLVTVFFAVGIPHFAILMGLIGSFTGTMLSLIWPSYFHLRIKWNYLEWYVIGFNVFIICLGCLCGVNGIYYSFRALIKAYEIKIQV
uniref:Vesicular inhibitory amino acid transporter n=1 Tax=Strigamia maritima TaxID=126957 RepID=T1JBV7_STRMM